MALNQVDPHAHSSAMHVSTSQCSLGTVLVAQSDAGICAIALGDDATALRAELQQQFPHVNFVKNTPQHSLLVSQVIALIENPRTNIDIPLDIHGTLFQQRVWQSLRTIPTGTTISYSNLATRIDSPKAARAVASACAANVLAVVIPCHRVVRNNGDLSGYRWGVERKRALLQAEQNI